MSSWPVAILDRSRDNLWEKSAAATDRGTAGSRAVLQERDAPSTLDTPGRNLVASATKVVKRVTRETAT